MILTAGPGVGKSVLSAKVCELYRDQLASCHFCDYRNSDYSNPHRILQSLASQMCGNVDGFSDKLTEVLRREHSRDSLSDAFRVLLNDPLHALGRREPMLIVVDALDESKTDVKSELLDLISDEFLELPKWIKILISSRPELQVQKKLQHFNPLEIRPDDQNHNLDLEHFIKHCLPHLDEGNVSLLKSKCEGSFLYAYYLVHELKDIDWGIKPNLSDFVPKGISGFYEKQFKRLKTGLQRFKPGVFKSFVNVVGAARASLLPFKILFACMDVPDEIYEIRKAIIDIMSEILPVYDDCLSVYHKSLTDWLILDGYEEHTFVADVADGTKRLWSACKSIYSDIDSLKFVSDFKVSVERKFALDNGVGYLVNVGDTENFQWLVNVKLNFFKLKFCRDLNIDFYHILKKYKSKLSEHLYWKIFQHHNILKSLLKGGDERTKCHIYLQSLANGYFNFMQNSNSCKSVARYILDETKGIWMEEVANAYNTKYKIVSNTVFEKSPKCIASSPDYKLLVCLHEQSIVVFKSPCLTMIFALERNWINDSSNFLTFAPDSSYFLSNSVRSSICIREQKEVPFIPHGPETILSCSFSSCGMRLVTLEQDFIKVWDVGKKVLLRQIQSQPFYTYDYCFIKGDPCILGLCRSGKFALWHSTTLEKQDINNICCDTCLTYNDIDNIHIISHPCLFSDSDISIATRHFHLPNGEIVLITNKNCSKPFSWKGRKCVLFSTSFPSVVYDFIKQEVVDTFRIDCLPCVLSARINRMSKLDGTNFFICLNDNQAILLSFESNSVELSVAPFLNNAAVNCSTVSADNLYVVRCYENRILTIYSVDNGKSLQTVVLKQSPVACWWSELYLWVVCEDVVVKFPYDSSNTNVLGNNLVECSINFDDVLEFSEGVLVIQSNYIEISILKVCNEKLCPQQIPPNPNFFATSVAVSSDGCAVFLYCLWLQKYQLWEVASENRWELTSSSKYKLFENLEYLGDDEDVEYHEDDEDVENNEDDEDVENNEDDEDVENNEDDENLEHLEDHEDKEDYDDNEDDDDYEEYEDDEDDYCGDMDMFKLSRAQYWFFLADAQNSRRCLWLNHNKFCRRYSYFEDNLSLCVIDLANDMQHEDEIFIDGYVWRVIYSLHGFLIIHEDVWIHLVKASDCKIIATLYLGKQGIWEDEFSFYLTSRGAFLLLLKNDVRYFKIHNIENYL